MKRIFSLFLAASFLLASAPSAQASPDDIKDKIGNAFNRGKNGVVGAFNKVKGKITGKSANDSTAAGSSKSDSKPAKKKDDFKKKKVNVQYPGYNKRYYYTKKHKYKGADKTDFNLGFSGSIFYDYDTGKIKKEVNLYRDIYGLSHIVIPAGTEILIRTANDKVHKAVTLYTFENKSQMSNIGHFSPADNQYHMYGVEETWTDLSPDYYIDEETINDILNYGIIKMRIGTTDLVLEGKDFEKEHKEMKDYLQSILNEINQQERIWKNSPPRRPAAPTVSEF